MLRITNFKEAMLEVKKKAEKRLARNENADEFVEIGNVDGFKIYVTAGKTVENKKPQTLHANPRDVFMLILQGEIEFTFENGKTTKVKANECYVLPKNLKHKCVFKKMTMAIEGIYEKRL